MAVDISVGIGYFSNSALNYYIDLGEVTGCNWDA